MGRDLESSDHFKNGDLIREEPAMAHGMTATMDLMMILMMIAMAGFSLALGVADGGLAGIASGAFMLLVGALLTWDGVVGLIER